jgi:hypothetical protein
MITTPWKEYVEDGQRYRIRATYGIDRDFGKRNNQAPYFSITGETESSARNGRWVEHSGGCSHEQIAKHFPELEPLIKWHLTSTEGPMHYEANALYWWEHVLGSKTFRESYEWEKYGSPKAAALHHLKSTIVFGVIDGEQLPPESAQPLYSIDSMSAKREWLAARLPVLLCTFESEMKKAGCW